MKKMFHEIAECEIEVITNGYDQADYDYRSQALDQKFSIAQIGMLMKSQNPGFLWKVLKELIDENPAFGNDLEIKIVGKVDAVVIESFEKNNLLKHVKTIDYIPHNEVIAKQMESQVLLLLINQVENAQYFLTGKLFEYLAARRPILCIGPPDGDAAEIIKETGAGEVVDFRDKAALKKALSKYYAAYKNRNLVVNTSGAEKYSRQALTKKLTEAFDRLI
jgi:glycosyltransferase involved in cell wall biosynthesis